MGKNRIETEILQKKEKKQSLMFSFILIITVFAFYYNTVYNHFSLDDHYVNIENTTIAKGFAGIPEIFTTLYSEESGMAFGYRPVTRASFAIEYQFTGDSDKNPYISHFINILIYLMAVLVLFKVLKRLFQNKNPWFAFLIAILFVAHPTHTEVVASLKNRDVLLNFLFSFIAIWQFLKWADFKKSKHLIFGLISYVFALLSKETAIAQLAVFPLILYFFTDINKKKLTYFIVTSVVIVGAVLIFRSLILPETSRDLRMWENPLVQNENIFLHIGTSIYVIGHYLKMLFIPFPLLYYYGYDMIPMVGFNNIWVIITLVIIIGMLVYAVLKLKKKDIISFAIIYFFINMSMYMNIVSPVPGIVADRFLFFATLSFSIFVIWLLFTIFRIPIEKSTKRNKRIIWVTIIVLLIITPYGYYVHERNKHWQTEFSLYSVDMPKLENSVKANALFAHELMNRVNAELAKPVNPYKFIIKTINKADKHYQKVIELDSTHYTTWNNLGIIYSKIHGNQAKLRVRSHLKRNKIEEAEKEKANSKKFFDQSVIYFRNAIKYKPDFGSAYFNLANAYDLQQQYDSSVIYFRKAEEVDGGELVSMSRLANAYFKNGQVQEAVQKNEEIIKKYPKSDKPYVNLGNYAFEVNDTVNGIKFFVQAVQLGTRPEVGKFLSGFYNSIGDKRSADYYLRKSKEAEQLASKTK